MMHLTAYGDKCRSYKAFYQLFTRRLRRIGSERRYVASHKLRLKIAVSVIRFHSWAPFSSKTYIEPTIESGRGASLI